MLTRCAGSSGLAGFAVESLPTNDSTAKGSRRVPADLVLHLSVRAADELKAAGQIHLRPLGPEPTPTDAEVLAIQPAGVGATADEFDAVTR